MSEISSADARRFRAFEQEGWEAIPDQYDEAFADLTSQAVGALLSALGVGPGRRVLDVACGPGYVAAAALARGSEVVGLDFSAAMVRRARAAHGGIEFREGDAEALPFEDGTVHQVRLKFFMPNGMAFDGIIGQIRRTQKEMTFVYGVQFLEIRWMDRVRLWWYITTR